MRMSPVQNLMKLGHSLRAALDLPEEDKPPIRKFKSWAFGITIFSVGNVLNFVSFGKRCGIQCRVVPGRERLTRRIPWRSICAAFAAQSLLAALGSLQLVANVFFAYLVNHEPVSREHAEAAAPVRQVGAT